MTCGKQFSRMIQMPALQQPVVHQSLFEACVTMQTGQQSPILIRQDQDMGVGTIRGPILEGIEVVSSVAASFTTSRLKARHIVIKQG